METKNYSIYSEKKIVYLKQGSVRVNLLLADCFMRYKTVDEAIRYLEWVKTLVPEEYRSKLIFEADGVPGYDGDVDCELSCYYHRPATELELVIEKQKLSKSLKLSIDRAEQQLKDL
jgi:hypothetical protein